MVVNKMSNRIELNNKVLEWAIKTSKISEIDLKKKFKKIDQWKKNEPSPTFNQVIDLSKFLNIPFGYLLLDEPPNDEIEALSFRTIGTKEIEKPSRELIDTISDMRRRQEWMREYLISEGYEQNQLFKTIEISDDVYEAVNIVRSKLKISELWFTNCNQNFYKFIKEIISMTGILVMQNGIVRNNTYRSLDVEEFRGFCLSDSYVPLIFINNNDSENGKLFTLFHELIHVFLGEETLYSNDIELTDKSEVFCNKIASELILPTTYFIEKWEKSTYNLMFDKIVDVSKYFPASDLAVARKSLDLNLIDKKTYTEIEKNTEVIVRKKKSKGGSFYNNNISRIDNNFILALSNKLNNGETSSSDIYKLTGLKRNSFEKIVNNLEGVK